MTRVSSTFALAALLFGITPGFVPGGGSSLQPALAQTSLLKGQAQRRIPDLGTLEAAGSHLPIRLSALGKPALLLLHSPATAELATRVDCTLRRDHPSTTDLLIIHVVDGRAFPWFAHPIAQAIMDKAYARAAKKEPAGVNPVDHVIIVPDWSGEAFAGLGLANADHDIGIALLDGQARVIGTYQGPAPLAHATVLLQKLNL